jgi:hypothetical protein
MSLEGFEDYLHSRNNRSVLQIKLMKGQDEVVF